MNNPSIVHVNENTQEHVAYRLFMDIAKAEGIVFVPDPPPGYQTAERKWILETYAACLKAVKS